MTVEQLAGRRRQGRRARHRRCRAGPRRRHELTSQLLARVPVPPMRHGHRRVRWPECSRGRWVVSCSRVRTGDHSHPAARGHRSRRRSPCSSAGSRRTRSSGSARGRSAATTRSSRSRRCGSPRSPSPPGSSCRSSRRSAGPCRTAGRIGQGGRPVLAEDRAPGGRAGHRGAARDPRHQPADRGRLLRRRLGDGRRPDGRLRRLRPGDHRPRHLLRLGPLQRLRRSSSAATASCASCCASPSPSSASRPPAPTGSPSPWPRSSASPSSSPAARCAPTTARRRRGRRSPRTSAGCSSARCSRPPSSTPARSPPRCSPTRTRTSRSRSSPTACCSPASRCSCSRPCRPPCSPGSAAWPPAASSPSSGPG